MKLLVDTDIGDDIDDALALGLGLKCGADIVGITTVFGDTVRRARIARKLLSAAGRDVPVYAGLGEPYRGHTKPLVMSQYSADLDEGCDPVNAGGDGDRAVDFILNQAERYGEELTLLLIGPETNAARAVERDPALMRRVGRVVVMGGSFTLHHKEWNIVCDTEAARIVLESGCRVECVGWDVTQKVQLSRAQQEAICALHCGGLEGYLAGLVRRWSACNGYAPILHDPLAMECCLRPDSVRMEETGVRVVQSGLCRGLTLNCNQCIHDDPALLAPVPIKAAVSVDAGRFIKYFMKAVFGL